MSYSKRYAPYSRKFFTGAKYHGIAQIFYGIGTYTVDVCTSQLHESRHNYYSAH